MQLTDHEPVVSIMKDVTIKQEQSPMTTSGDSVSEKHFEGDLKSTTESHDQTNAHCPPFVPRPPQSRMHVCHLCDTNFSDIAMFNLHMKAHAAESEKERMQRKRPVVYFSVHGDVPGQPPIKLPKTGNQRGMVSPVSMVVDGQSPRGRPQPNHMTASRSRLNDGIVTQTVLLLKDRSPISEAPSPVIDRVFMVKGKTEAAASYQETLERKDAHRFDTTTEVMSKSQPTVQADTSTVNVIGTKDGATTFVRHGIQYTTPDDRMSRQMREPSQNRVRRESGTEAKVEQAVTGCRSTNVIPQMAECGLCGISFSAHILLDRHIQEIHLSDAGRFNCNFCPKDFASMTSVKRHIKSYHEGEQGVTQFCISRSIASPGSSASSDDGQRQRGESSVTFHGFSCSFCGRYFETPTHLQVHVSNEHPTLRPGVDSPKFQPQPKENTVKRGRDSRVVYLCPTCKAEFSVFDVFLEHLEKHVEERERSEDRRKMARFKELFCSECKIDYESMEAFLKHLEGCPGPRNMLTSNQQNGHPSVVVDHMAGKQPSKKPESEKGAELSGDIAKGGVGNEPKGGVTPPKKTVAQLPVPQGDLVNFYPDVVEVPVGSDANKQHQLCYSCQLCKSRFLKLDRYLDHLQGHEICMKTSNAPTSQSVPTTMISRTCSQEEERRHMSNLQNNVAKSTTEKEFRYVTIVSGDSNSTMRSPISLIPSNAPCMDKPSSDALVYHCHMCRMDFAKLDMYLDHLENHCKWRQEKPAESQDLGQSHFEQQAQITLRKLDQQPNVLEKGTSASSNRDPTATSTFVEVVPPPVCSSVLIPSSSSATLSKGVSRGDPTDSHVRQEVTRGRPTERLRGSQGDDSCRSHPSVENCSTVHYRPSMEHALEQRAEPTRPLEQPPSTRSLERRYSCPVCSKDLKDFDSYLNHVCNHTTPKSRSTEKEVELSKPSADVERAGSSGMMKSKLVYCVIPVLLGARTRECSECGFEFMCQFCDVFFSGLEELKRHMTQHFPLICAQSGTAGIQGSDNGIPLIWEKDHQLKTSEEEKYQRESNVVMDADRAELAKSDGLNEKRDGILSPYTRISASPTRSKSPKRGSVLYEVASHASNSNDQSDEVYPAYICKTCRLGCVSLDDILRHISETGHDSRIEQVRDVESGRIACPVCGVKVRSQEKFMTHLRHQHLFKKSHVCPTCNVGFGRKIDLFFHLEQCHPGHMTSQERRALQELPMEEMLHKAEEGKSDGVVVVSDLPQSEDETGKDHDEQDEEKDSNTGDVEYPVDDGTTSDSVFICQPCRRQFSEENEFLEHIETHQSSRPQENREASSQADESGKTPPLTTKLEGEGAPMIGEYWSLAGDKGASQTEPS